MSDILNTPTGAGKTEISHLAPCADGHQFVWQSPNYAMQYSVPAGLRCMCGAVAFDDLVDEAGRCGRIEDVRPDGETLGAGEG